MMMKQAERCLELEDEDWAERFERKNDNLSTGEISMMRKRMKYQGILVG